MEMGPQRHRSKGSTQHCEGILAAYIHQKYKTVVTPLYMLKVHACFCIFIFMHDRMRVIIAALRVRAYSASLQPDCFALMCRQLKDRPGDILPRLSSGSEFYTFQGVGSSSFVF